MADAGDIADAGTASISRDASVIGSNSAGGDVVASGNRRRRDANVANVASGLLREGVGDFIRGGHDDSYDEDTIPRDVAGGSGGSVLAQVPGFEGVEGFAEDRPDDAPERGRFGEPVAASLGARFDRDYGEPGDDDYEYDYDYRDYALWERGATSARPAARPRASRGLRSTSAPNPDRPPASSSR